MEQKSNGGMISAIIIIALLLIGGFFFWKNNAKESVDQAKVENSAENSQAPADTSDISSIDADVNSMDYNGLDEGF